MDETQNNQIEYSPELEAEITAELKKLVPRYRKFPDSVEFKNSEVEGTGLFAKQEIGDRIEVAKLGGVLVHRDKVQEYLAKVGNFGPQINKDWFISPLTRAELPGAINHSCAPNIGMRDELTFQTLRPIRAGEKLVADYGQTGLMRGFECNCGAPNCKHHISTEGWRGDRPHTELTDFLNVKGDLIKKLREQGRLTDYVF